MTRVDLQTTKVTKLDPKNKQWIFKTKAYKKDLPTCKAQHTGNTTGNTFYYTLLILFDAKPLKKFFPRL